MTMRAIGAFNGLLPEATGQVIAFMRDPSKMPFLRYSQYVPAPEIQFEWCQLDSNDIQRLPNIEEFAWDYDDYRPSGKGFKPRAKWIADRIQRWDFPYQVGNATQRVWGKGGVNVKALLDSMRMNHAMLHRASRVVTALRTADWGSHAGTPQSLLGLASPVSFAESSGQELTQAGNPNPNFQIIKKTLQRIKRLIHLDTNAAVTTEKLFWILSPSDAQLVSQSGEMFEALKQSRYAKELTEPQLAMVANWDLPATYAGFEIIVEDTPRVLVRQKETDQGTIADLIVPNEKDYILPAGESYFASRPAGLDGTYGTQNFSTVQIYTLNGESKVEAFSEPKHDLVEGHIVCEDKVILPASISGFKLTGIAA